jgi:hypothetical protein
VDSVPDPLLFFSGSAGLQKLRLASNIADWGGGDFCWGTLLGSRESDEL